MPLIQVLGLNPTGSDTTDFTTKNVPKTKMPLGTRPHLYSQWQLHVPSPAT